MKFHVILALVAYLFEIGPCFVTSFQDCRDDEECPVGSYCGGASGLCEYCSCCCPDQISKQEFNGKCQKDHMPPYQWCYQPKPEYECPCATVPVTDSSRTSHESSTISNQEDHTATVNTTVNVTLNATTSAPAPTTVPPAKPSYQWLKWFWIGFAIAIAVIGISIFIIYKYRRRSTKTQGDYVSLPPDVEVVSQGTHDEAGEFESPNKLEDQPSGNKETLGDDDLLKDTDPGGNNSENNDNELEMRTIASENTNTDVDPDSGIDDRSSPSSISSEESNKESTKDAKDIRKEAQCCRNDDEAGGSESPNQASGNEEMLLGATALLPRPRQEESTQFNDPGGTNSENTHNDSENLKCTLTVSGMLENIPFTDELVFLDVPIGGKCVVDYLAQEFTDIKTNTMLAVKHYAGLYDSAIKTVFHKMKTKKPKLKCVEIVRFLQNPNLQRNDVILVIQKHHMECPACQVYYNKIENMSSSVSETQPASPEIC